MDKPQRSTTWVVALLSIGVGLGLVPAAAARAQKTSGSTTQPGACPTGQVAAKDGSCTKSNGAGVSGKTTHDPIKVTKEAGAASPQLLSGATNNETFKPAPGGTKPNKTPPVKLTKESGAASPQLLSSSATSENLKTVPSVTPKPKPCTNSKVPTAQAQGPPPKPKKG
jgi:hypothetical protein